MTTSNFRQIASSTILYGLADSLVVLVGGFLLLPLYTAALSREEFGSYIAVRTNLELLTYLMHFGLISAVSRLYFDYRLRGEGRAYIVSIALWFPLQLLFAGVFLLTVGRLIWGELSPGVAVMPNLLFAFAIAAANFYFNLTTTTLRAEQRVATFVAVQLGAAAVLVGAAFFLLVGQRLGLIGLMGALFASAAAGALALPLTLQGGTPLHLDFAHVRHSLRYALPIVAGLVSFFILNRVSILILQRFVPVADLALYGLAQQIALVVTVAAVAFGKAIQPVLFAAEPERLPALLRQWMAIYVLALSSVASLILVFSVDIIALVAPVSYRAALLIILILVTAAFVYGLTLTSDTAVLCMRKPGASAAITAGGAALSAILSLALIPRFGLVGGAAALLIASSVLVVAADRVAWRMTGFSNRWPTIAGFAIVAATALVANCINGLGVSDAVALVLRCIVAFFLIAGHLAIFVNFLRAPT